MADDSIEREIEGLRSLLRLHVRATTQLAQSLTAQQSSLLSLIQDDKAKARTEFISASGLLTTYFTTMTELLKVLTQQQVGGSRGPGDE